MKKSGNIIPFRQKPTELLSQGNAYIPSTSAFERFKLPPRRTLPHIKGVADTIGLHELGVEVPRGCVHKDRFEEGFRHGLQTNSLMDTTKHFRKSFAWGFCWAKYFYRKFNPDHPLACGGAFKAKG